MRKLWLNSTRLAELLPDTGLEHERLAWREKLTLDDYKQVLAASHPYIAIVKNGQLESFASRDRLALRAARLLVSRPGM